jgi:hypothetical protein
LIYGKGGILSLTGTQIKFAPPINEWGNHNYGSKFFNSRYDNNSIIRGYTRLRYAAPVTVNGRQPFVVKSKYRKIGPWGFTLPGQGGTLTADLNGWFSNPGRIVGVDASLFSDMSGNSFAISNFRRSHERPDGWGLSGMRNGKVASELGVEVFSSSSGRTLLEVVNPTGNGYYSLWGHGGTTDNRGWIRLDYLAAKCGEGGNGFFTNAANIGYGFTPSDCSGYANADGIATHVIESQGQDISGNADQFRYLYKAGNYSTTLVGKIDQVEKSSAKALGCLMFRANTTPGSRNVALCRTGADSVYFQYRNTPDGPTTRSLFTQHPYSKWLKLEKSGDTFRAYVSDKDDSWNPSSTTGWVQIGSFYVPTIGSSYLYGIGASSNDASNPATVGILGVKTL